MNKPERNWRGFVYIRVAPGSRPDIFSGKFSSTGFTSKKERKVLSGRPGDGTGIKESTEP